MRKKEGTIYCTPKYNIVRTPINTQVGAIIEERIETTFI